MPKLAPTLTILVAALSLSGCLISTDVYTGQSNTSKREFLSYAGARSPVFLDVIGASNYAAAAARHASGSVPGLPTVFTAVRTEAGQPGFHVALALDAPANARLETLCAGTPIPPVQRRSSRGILAAFCAGGEPISGARAKIPSHSGPDDPEFARAVTMVMVEMFPINQPDRENQRQWITN
ncbi:MAG: hypothetical protein HOL85_02130 [Rhodospirillaceae bacterium]|jgi:hypothetical protein|nr:hypothetical protein [Rhodospirillaceae bacterium]MBT6136972.1 hypothetical protein [Rhodospirillaceae bacterium]